MIHREGILHVVIAATLATITGIVAIISPSIWTALLFFVFFIIELFILWFFRNPKRAIDELPGAILSPCDGKVVVIEETEEPEYFKDRRIQVSIFMSPLNVHANRNCMTGEVAYSKYHPGKYLVAWHPKSSTENERHTIVYKNQKIQVLVRQIAGFMARRIKNYLTEGQRVEQGSEMGFIKFGSRVDLFLPLDAEIIVEMGEKVQANYSLIAKY